SGRRLQPYGSLRHPQDDSGDLLSRCRLTMSRVTGGIQTADGDGDSCVLDLLPLGQEALAAVWISQAPSDDSGDVLLMMSGRRLQPYGSLKHRQDDSGDVLLMIPVMGMRIHVSVSCCLEVRKRWQQYGSLKHRQDDSGDVLLMIVLHPRLVLLVVFRLLMGMEIHVSLIYLWVKKSACIVYESLRHRQVDSGDVLLMMSGALAAVWISQAPSDDSGDVLLMIVKLTKSC
ncbi:Kynurenine--Oxoglutarate Transaminase 3, partial [Manis pentadactyla]